MNLVLAYALIGVATALLIAYLTRQTDRAVASRVAGAIVSGLIWPVVVAVAVIFIAADALADVVGRWTR